MSDRSKIEWTDATFNPWIGCTKVSPGCDHCYAEALDRRFAVSSHAMHWGAGKARRRTSESNWRQPRRWNAAHHAFFAAHGRRRRVFCASLADVFDNEVPPEWRVDLFRLIEATPNLDWLLLTKRIGNAAQMMFLARGGHLPLLPNLWIGATVVNQEEADRDVPKLLDTRAAVRFVSIEPLLGDIRLGSFLQRAPSAAFADGRVTRDMPAWTRIGATAIDWVICGGESGRHARPMHPDWARSLRDECSAAGVPFLFKQWGEWLPWHHFTDARIDDPPEATRFATREWLGDRWIDIGRPDFWGSKDGDIDDMQCVGRVGKKAAGRLLDGREWNGFPTEAAR